MIDQSALKSRLLAHLRGGQAFVPLDNALDGVSYDLAASKPDQMSHTIYGFIFHMYKAIEDILDYVEVENYKRMTWPDDYWPINETELYADTWKDTVNQLEMQLQRTEKMLEDESSDLLAEIPWTAEGHTKLRAVLLVIEHNAYHTGQIIDVRKALGEWGGWS